MVSLDADIWIGACAHRLHQRWRTLDAGVLQALAHDLWQDEHLRGMAPADAAAEWLRPVASEDVQPLRHAGAG